MINNLQTQIEELRGNGYTWFDAAGNPIKQQGGLSQFSRSPRSENGTVPFAERKCGSENGTVPFAAGPPLPRA